MVAPTSFVVVFSCSALVVTRTVSDVVPTSRSTDTSVVRPDSTTTEAMTAVLKPVAVALSLYDPNWRLGKRKFPSLEEIVLC